MRNVRFLALLIASTGTIGCDKPVGELNDDAKDALVNGDIDGAIDQFEQILDGDPTNSEANLGVALARLTNLPELPAIDDALALCGQPPVDALGQIFGVDGIKAWEQASRGFGSLPSINKPANSVAVTEFDLATARSHVRQNDYRNSGTDWTSLSFDAFAIDSFGRIQELYGNLTLPAAAVAANGVITLDPQQSNVGVSLHAERGDGFRDYFNGSLSTNPGSITATLINGELTVEFTDFEMTDNFGFEDCYFNCQDDTCWDCGTSQCFDDCSAACDTACNTPLNGPQFVIDGTFSDAVDDPFVLPASVFPFSDYETFDTIADVVAACGPGVDQDRVFDIIGPFFAELALIRDNLGAIIDGHGNAFAGEIPAEFLANSEAISLGIATIRVWRASLSLALAAWATVEQYHFFRANFDEMISEVNGRVEVNETLVRRELNESILVPRAQPIALTETLQLIQSAIVDAREAVDSEPVVSATIDPRLLPASARTEMRRLANEGLESLDTEVGLIDTPEYRVHPHRLFDDPITRDKIYAEFGIFELFSETSFGDIQVAEEIWTALQNRLVTLPEDSTITCETDFDCTAPLQCSGWADQGICSSNPGQSCLDFSDCVNFDCNFSVCGGRDPLLVDEQSFEAVGEYSDSRQAAPDFVVTPRPAMLAGSGFAWAVSNLDAEEGIYQRPFVPTGADECFQLQDLWWDCTGSSVDLGCFAYDEAGIDCSDYFQTALETFDCVNSVPEFTYGLACG